MALIVEDGSGVEDADAYISIVDADAYHLRYGNAAWSNFDDETKEILIRKATRDMDLLYEYVGEEVSPTQSLEWPRTTITGLPDQIAQGCAEMALIENSFDPVGPLSDASNVKSLEQQVGSLMKKTEYFNAGQSTEQSNLRKVNLLISSFTTSSSVSSMYSRVDRG